MKKKINNFYLIYIFILIPIFPDLLSVDNNNYFNTKILKLNLMYI